MEWQDTALFDLKKAEKQLLRRSSNQNDLNSLHRYVANPEHDTLWNTDDTNFLDLVMCHAVCKVWQIDPKNGCFECRMRCYWQFRLPNTHARTEPRVRIPGVRMPSVSCTVDESRVWRDMEGDTFETMLFRGISVFSFTGFEVFEIKEFPFDRQVINLELFDFVWRKEKDTDTYEESMKIVHFTLDTLSMLPQWKPEKGIIQPMNESDSTEVKKPKFCTRFYVELRLERKHEYYVVQVFMVSVLILLASLLPMAMDCTEDTIGDKLALHAGGLLTLTAFKFAIAENLPSVPYSTFTDMFLMLQVVTLVVASIFALVIYKITQETALTIQAANAISITLLILASVAWTGAFIWTGVLRPSLRKPWGQVLKEQDKICEKTDSDEDHPLRAVL